MTGQRVHGTWYQDKYEDSTLNTENRDIEEFQLNN